jgi:hypothetical protein
MSTTYTQRLHDRPELLNAAQQASTVLDDVLGESAERVDATWDAITDQKGRELVVLTVQDPFAGAVSTEFSPDEFQSRRHLDRRLYRFWGDVLQTRSHVQLDQLRAQVG